MIIKYRSTFVNISECDSYTWLVNGQSYTQTGLYTDSSSNVNGCLHIDSLYLTINNTTSSSFIYKCDSYTSLVNGHSYT